MLTAAGTPYGVFTPFWRTLEQASRRRSCCRARDAIHTPPDASRTRVAARPAGRRSEPPLPGLPARARSAAQRRLRAWVAGGLADYGERPGRAGRRGHLAPRRRPALRDAVAAAGRVGRAETRRSGRHPSCASSPGASSTTTCSSIDARRRPRGRRVRSWRSSAPRPRTRRRWRPGARDAPASPPWTPACASWRRPGWLSNRARLVVASFLTRHLLMDYRIGERHFLRHLVDGDVANNRGGWQWSAGVGATRSPGSASSIRCSRASASTPRERGCVAGSPSWHVSRPGTSMLPGRCRNTRPRDAGVRLGETYPRPVVDLRPPANVPWRPSRQGRRRTRERRGS